MAFGIFRQQSPVVNSGDPYQYAEIAHGFVQHGFATLTRRAASLYPELIAVVCRLGGDDLCGSAAARRDDIAENEAAIAGELPLGVLHVAGRQFLVRSHLKLSYAPVDHETIQPIAPGNQCAAIRLPYRCATAAH